MVSHPNREAVERALARLVVSVRAPATRDDMYEVQRELANWLLEAERRFGEANAARKRRRESLDWDVEFWRRSVKQFRAIGDALAWRFLGYRRQWVILLGTNQDPGHMRLKNGLAGELDVFERRWQAGEPALLNGLTNCLTILDLLVAEDEVLTLLEVKPEGRGMTRSQRERADRVTRQINEAPRLEGDPDPTYIQESDVPLKSYWTEAGDAIARAATLGVAQWSPAPGVVVRFVDGPAAARVGREVGQANFEAERASTAQEIGELSHRLETDTAGWPYFGRGIVPIPLLPIAPDRAAALLTGSLLMKSAVSVDGLVDAIRDVGFDVEVALDGKGGPLQASQPIVRWQHGRDRGSVNSTATTQMGVELIPYSVIAQALASRQRPGPERRAHSYICFADEGDVWA